MLKVLDLFSGIGGFSLGLERTGGFKTVAFCEIEEFPRRVLAKHWPDIPIHHDVRTLKGSDVGAIDVICGGFPCQDISTAGLQGGMGAETRSGLWSEIARLVGETRPRYVIVENVSALLSGPSQQPGGWFGRVLGDLATLGYDAEWHCIPASAVGAPHIRDRVWIIAYPQYPDADCAGPHRAQEYLNGDAEPANEQVRLFKPLGAFLADALRGRQSGSRWPIDAGDPEASGDRQVNRVIHDSGWDVEPNVGRVAYGVPFGVERLTALGNAVVPQIPEIIGRAILEAERDYLPEGWQNGRTG